MRLEPIRGAIGTGKAKQTMASRSVAERSVHRCVATMIVMSPTSASMLARKESKNTAPITAATNDIVQSFRSPVETILYYMNRLQKTNSQYYTGKQLSPFCMFAKCGDGDESILIVLASTSLRQ